MPQACMRAIFMREARKHRYRKRMHNGHCKQDRRNDLDGMRHVHAVPFKADKKEIKHRAQTMLVLTRTIPYVVTWANAFAIDSV
jgi:hypothetical protein